MLPTVVPTGTLAVDTMGDEELKERFEALSDIELDRIVTIDSRDYTAQALAIARAEVVRRGLDLRTHEQISTEPVSLNVNGSRHSAAAGEDAIRRLAAMFTVVTALSVVTTVLCIYNVLNTPHVTAVAALVASIFLTILAAVTLRGVERQRYWAKRLAYIQGVLLLFAFPLGTLIGLAVLVYVRRASKASQFATAALEGHE